MTTRVKVFVLSLIMAFGLSACGSTRSFHASSKEEIDAKVQGALLSFYQQVEGGRSLVSKASGVLVFPDIVKGGIGLGAEYGTGSLMVGGKPVDYYRITSGSFGFQLGGQVYSQVVLFMEPNALNRFRDSEGWEAGVDGSIAVVAVGAGGEIDSSNIRSPIIGFVFSNKGLMYNLTLEGTKYTRIDR